MGQRNVAQHYKKLAGVGVGAAVSHGKHAFCYTPPGSLEYWDLIHPQMFLQKRCLLRCLCRRVLRLNYETFGNAMKS